MNKIYLFGLVLLLSFGLASGAYARGHMGKAGFMTFDTFDLIGAPVKNTRGELLGLVSWVEVDSAGDAIAIINHGSDAYYGDGGGYTPVPIKALRISEPTAGHLAVVLNSNDKKLESAPAYDPTRDNDRPYETQVYRYYGLQPYWTEEGKCLE